MKDNDLGFNKMIDREIKFLEKLKGSIFNSEKFYREIERRIEEFKFMKN